MNLTLVRKSYQLYGILGQLLDDSGNLLGVTLEHAFPDGNGGFVPKLAAGTYTCQRGVHRLSNLNPFETFEVMNVPPFQSCAVTGILLHVGNYNKDSEGCILLGSSLGAGCILDSREAFDHFMALQQGIDSFVLVVQDSTT